MPENFGRPLTQESLDDCLFQIRDSRQVYRDTHPEDIEYIKELTQ